MSYKRYSWVCAFLLTISLQGCASLFTTFGEEKNKENNSYKNIYYSGVKANSEQLTNISSDYGLALIFVPFYVVDLPLCLVADTLFLPYKFYYRATNPAPVAPVKPPTVKPLSPLGQ